MNVVASEPVEVQPAVECEHGLDVVAVRRQRRLALVVLGQERALDARNLKQFKSR